MRVESFRRRLYKTSYLQGHTRMCWFKIFSCFFKRNHLQTILSSVSTDPFFVSLVFISHRKSSQERLFWWALLMCSQACLYKLTKIHDLSVSKVMVVIVWKGRYNVSSRDHVFDFRHPSQQVGSDCGHGAHGHVAVWEDVDDALGPVRPFDDDDPGRPLELSYIRSHYDSKLV